MGTLDNIADDLGESVAEEALDRQCSQVVLLQTRVFDENGESGTSVALHANK